MPPGWGGSKGRRWGEKDVVEVRLHRPPSARRYSLRLYLRRDRGASAYRGGRNAAPGPKTGNKTGRWRRADGHDARQSRTAFNNRDAYGYRIPRGPRGGCRRRGG